MSSDTAPDFGSNQMPPELAVKLLERAQRIRPSPEQVEALDVLREECAETIQRATKITRFGLDSRQPSTDRLNTDTLTEEVGHALAAIDLTILLGMVDYTGAHMARMRKLADYAQPGGVLRAASEHTRACIVRIIGVLAESLADIEKQQCERDTTPPPTDGFGEF